MTNHKALHMRDDIDRLYVSIKEEERKVASTKDLYRCNNSGTWRIYKNEQRKSDYRSQ